MKSYHYIYAQLLHHQKQSKSWGNSARAGPNLHETEIRGQYDFALNLSVTFFEELSDNCCLQHGLSFRFTQCQFLSCKGRPTLVHMPIFLTAFLVEIAEHL